MHELAEALRDLHRAVVERLRRGEERGDGVVSAAQFLALLMSDSRFAWLHVLSELIVDAEIFLKADPAPTDDDCAALRDEVERLLIAPRFPESAAAFAREYSRHLARDEHVAAAHARVERLVQRLPQAEAVDEARVLHDRHEWTEVHRHRRQADRR